MKRYLFLTLAVLLCTLSASAYDFMVDSIAYYKNDDGTSVRVASGVRYKGDIVIPENVTYDGVIYSVSCNQNRGQNIRTMPQSDLNHYPQLRHRNL